MQQDHHQELPLVTSGEDLSLSQKDTPTINSEMHLDHARQLQIWLDLPTAREQRRFLEAHCELLDEHCETILQDLLMQKSAGTMEAQKRREILLLLHDTRRRGGTAEAVREAYINLHGGFVLDLPPGWKKWSNISLSCATKTVQRRPQKHVWNYCRRRWRAQEDAAYAPELLITLRLELADAWYRHPHINRGIGTRISTVPKRLKLSSIYIKKSCIFTQ